MKPKTAPWVPASTSNHQQHGVMRNEHGGVAVRHPALPGPNMMQARPDHVELPSGSLAGTAPGGIEGGLAPYQSEKGVEAADWKQ